MWDFFRGLCLKQVGGHWESIFVQESPWGKRGGRQMTSISIPNLPGLFQWSNKSLKVGTHSEVRVLHDVVQCCSLSAVLVAVVVQDKLYLLGYVTCLQRLRLSCLALYVFLCLKRNEGFELTMSKINMHEQKQ